MIARPSARIRRATASKRSLDGLTAPRAACKAPVRSKLEEAFAFQVKAMDLVEPKREYRFDAKRKWRADFAWPLEMLLVEIEGGIWSAGRHTRASGFIADCDKYNRAAEMGYRVLRFTKEHIKSGNAVQLVARLVPTASEIWPGML